jgi:hypothetical protein
MFIMLENRIRDRKLSNHFPKYLSEYYKRGMTVHFRDLSCTLCRL